MSTDRNVHRPSVRPSVHRRPARLALSLPDAGSSGVVDATALRAEPLVPSLAASLARSRAVAPAPPRRRPDPWPLVMLCTALAVAVAFTGVVAAARLAPAVATERARLMDGHLTLHAVPTRPASAATHPRTAP